MQKAKPLYAAEGGTDDDAYLDGERALGKHRPGSESKITFVAAFSIDNQGHPLYARFSSIAGFTGPAIENWACNTLDQHCQILTVCLTCFNEIADTGGRIRSASPLTVRLRIYHSEEVFSHFHEHLIR